MTNNKYLVWVDCEMTGLDINKDQIIEIAVIITDTELNVKSTLDSIIIHCDDQILDSMDSWCTKHHGESGLTANVKSSTISLADAENTVLQFLINNNVLTQQWEQTAIYDRPVLAGNSVYMDRLFLRKQMPRFNSALHYRIIDVSGVKELCNNWYPEEFKNQPQKKKSHRALDDIIESIEELKYYRSSIFKQQ